MPVIGVTGGVASGKSLVTRLLAEALVAKGASQGATFSADDCVHQLLEENVAVAKAVTELFGPEALEESGKISRSFLRRAIFASEDRRKDLERLLHPRVRENWTALAEDFQTSSKYLIAEIPLLYETNSENYLGSVIVVEAGHRIQIERLSSKRGWSLETARRVIDAQMPAEEKRLRADYLILNNHTEKLLADQVELAATALLMRYA